MLGDDLERDEAGQLAVVRQAVGLDDVPIEVITTGRWEPADLIADCFSSGRVFLVGDAAHQLPPNRGGFGADTGIEDAHKRMADGLAAYASNSARADLDEDQPS
ncbi:FAD-dependent monooxygenase [Nocardia sp. NPDC101769]|uniref:FAD-dependent monooxygenase n=1 Tax=Nocardia sp. NPDC101769 TaxID=3364333 RepID=UPI003803EB90